MAPHHHSGRLELDGLTGGGRLVVLGHFRPVDDLPPGGDVLRPAVLILEVVGMLPHVNAHDRDEPIAVHERVVLVGGGHDLDGAVLSHRQPGPAGAEHPRRGGGEGSLELIERAVRRADLLGEDSRWLSAAVGPHDRPEHAVVVVAAACVVELRRLGAGHERDERGGLLARHGLVQVVDVRLVVEVVVELHRRRVDVRLEGAVVVRKRRE
mmetsp:Transcript_918/g.1904  ORF Transcript_918/g.1904 Transcript_918/m.1904 type:complete len:210 (-) Transcript_918:257-886(-)